MANNGKNDKIRTQVEADAIEATAIAIRHDVSAVSADVMKDEIEAGHLQSIGMMAIENAIDEDKSQYEDQLDEIQTHVNDAQKRLAAKEQEFNKEVERFKKQLKATELRKKLASAHKTLSGLSDTTYPLRGIKEEDGDIETTLKQDDKSEELKGRAGVIQWSFSVTFSVEGSRYGSGESIEFSGTRDLNEKCVKLYIDIEDIKKEISELMECNKSVRIQIQKLERERRDLQRKLRQEVISRSIVAKDINEMLKNTRKAVKQLQLPGSSK